MKFKHLFILFTFLLLAMSIAAVAAENSTVSGHTFTVPDGYIVYDKNIRQSFMANDTYHVILVAVPLDFRGIPEFKYQLSLAGYDFHDGVDNFIQGEFNVTAYKFTMDGFDGVLYFAEKDDDVYVLSYVCPIGEDLDNVPLNSILDSWVD